MEAMHRGLIDFREISSTQPLAFFFFFCPGPQGMLGRKQDPPNSQRPDSEGGESSQICPYSQAKNSDFL